MDNELNRLEEQILDEYANLVEKVQPELEKRLFYDVMPCWEDFKEYRMEELAQSGMKMTVVGKKRALTIQI